jgi:hypothetical protein
VSQMDGCRTTQRMRFTGSIAPCTARAHIPAIPNIAATPAIHAIRISGRCLPKSHQPTAPQAAGFAISPMDISESTGSDYSVYKGAAS